MATVLRETEGVPASYPIQPYPWSTEAALIGTAKIWPRIESWTAYRWQERAVVWIVEGPGDWVPRLSPAAVNTTEVWESDAWQAATLSPSALGGYVLDGEGPYRFTATVGDTGTPPAAVQEAARRLAEYFAAASGEELRTAAAGSLSDLGFRMERTPNWLARAMQYSGAADLLRPWRNLGAA